MKKILVIALSTFCLMFTAYGHAEITFQGFASFVGGTTLDSDETYVGYENKLEYDKNSLFGLQVSSNMGEGLTVTGQLIARGNENYQPEFEWMYLSYNVTPTLNAKMGRIRTPFYMFSEYLEVGYTYPWIRPPVELYAAQVTNMDGLSFLYDMPIGKMDTQYMIVIGNRDTFSNDPTATVSDYKPLVGINAQFEYEAYTTKLIYTQGDISFESTAIDGTVALFNTDTAFRDKYVAVKDSTVVFAGAALNMDFYPFSVLLEFSSIDFDDLILAADETRTLASVTYNFEPCAVTYSLSGNQKESDSALANKATGAVLQGTAAAILTSTDRDVMTHTLGYRHDFHDSAAFKVELISTEDSDLKTEATLVRFGVDMIF